MATSYSGRYAKPLGGNRHAFGGAGLNLGIEALAGEAELITTFDDFNHVFAIAAAGAGLGAAGTGWTTTDVTGIAGRSSINDRTQAQFESSLRVDCGATADGGLNAQLTGDTRDFPHIWIADDGPLAALDNTVIVFACRIGLINDTASTWDGKVFIGFANNAEPAIMTPATGVITPPTASGRPLVGFHVPEDGSIDFLTQRTGATALVLNTNFFDVFPAGTLSNPTALEATWFDLGFRMHVTDMDDDANNGAVRVYSRRVPGVGDDFGVAGAVAAGLRETQASSPDRAAQDSWREHTTVLLNQNPRVFNVANLVPTIEVINGGGAPGTQCLVDWWSMGISRFSRRFI